MGSIPSLAQWIKGSGVAAAVNQIQSLAQELPCATGVATRKKKKRVVGFTTAPSFSVLSEQVITYEILMILRNKQNILPLPLSTTVSLKSHFLINYIKNYYSSPTKLTHSML